MTVDGEWDVQDFKALKVKLTEANAELLKRQAKQCPALKTMKPNFGRALTL